MAGLPTRSLWVWVLPPLFCRGPSFGSMGLMLSPTMSPLTPLVKPVLPVPSPIRLWPWLAKVPDTSGPEPVKSTRFRATMVFVTLNVPPGSWKRPPPVWALFSAMVQLSRVAVLALMPPPSAPAELPLTVQLVSVAVAGRRCRRRRRSAELPLTVLLVSVRRDGH